jgi:hypothetical protein
VRPVHVVSIGLSRFRADVVRRALTRPDIVLIDWIDEASLIAGAERIDVAVVGSEGSRLPVICGILLYAAPRIRMLVIEEHGGDTTLYELKPMRVSLGNVGESELADAVLGVFAGEV